MLGDITYFLEDFLDGIFDVLSGGAGESAMIALIVFLVFWFLGLGIIFPIMAHAAAARHGKKSVLCAYLLYFSWSGIAAHRFYAGKAGSAILWILTCGFFGFGWLIDLFAIPGMIAAHNMKAVTNRNIQQNARMIQNMQAQQQQQYNQHAFAQQHQYIQHTPAQQQQQYNQDALAQQQYQSNQSPSSPSPRLYPLSGEFKNSFLDIPPTGIILGRDPDNAQLVINNPEVSRKHCVITFSNGQFYLTDYSANGTFMNSGKRLVKDVPLQIYKGDVFYIVDRNNKFRVDS